MPPIEERDHTRGPAGARIIIVEYGDYKCPFCRGAARDVDQLVDSAPDDIRFVCRHF